MITSLLIGIGGIIGMMVLWIGIQSAWRRTFSDEIDDPDVLAERRDCGSCGCKTQCANKIKQQTPSPSKVLHHGTAL